MVDESIFLSPHSRPGSTYHLYCRLVEVELVDDTVEPWVVLAEARGEQLCSSQ